MPLRGSEYSSIFASLLSDNLPKQSLAAPVAHGHGKQSRSSSGASGSSSSSSSGSSSSSTPGTSSSSSESDGDDDAFMEVDGQSEPHDAEKRQNSKGENQPQETKYRTMVYSVIIPGEEAPGK